MAVARTFDNGFNASANYIGMSASSTDGILTKEGTDTYTLSAGYDGENYGLGLIYAHADEACSFVADYKTCSTLGLTSLRGSSTSLGGYWTPNEGKTTLSASFGVLNAYVPAFTVDELNETHFGIDQELGQGVLSAAIKASDFYSVAGTHASADSLGEFTEIYYTFDLNDNTEITAGVSFALGDNEGTYWLDRTAVGGSATFKF